MQILVIEDDEQTASLVSGALRDDGHNVDVTGNGQQGLRSAAVGNYDVLIVDRMLPGLDGLSIVQSLKRANVGSRIIFLTALGGLEDRIEGLVSGGDDYLVKPFALGELVARVNVLGRRHGVQGENRLRVGNLELDLIAREVRRGDDVIVLQPREFKILEILMRNKGRVLTRTMLLEQVWDLHFDPKTSIVQTNISRLRSKIDRAADVPLLHTVRGVGYRIDDPD
jgi:two-component system OmpR family response regulator